MKKITLGSLFDGIGGFPYAASFYGIRSLWASEIIPECISVTKRHFPEMIHMGDITHLNGGKLPPVDIITFGSPCQGLSMAGQRRGLADERSALFMEAIRIIYEMKEATHGRYPKFALWENVPGALSSAGGYDYKAVLEAFAKSQIPMPRSGRWANAGMVRSRRTDLAWCVYSSQYFGTAQRRRRVFLIADFTGGKRAGEILFVPKSLRRYFEAGGTPRQGAAAFVGSGAERAGGKGSQLLFARKHCRGTVEILNDQGGNSVTVERSELSPTLRSQTHGNLPIVAGNITSVGLNENSVSKQFYVARQSGMKCMGGSQSNASILDDQSPTLTCAHGEAPILAKLFDDHYVRRVTPLECERLQGFPDYWTETGHEGQTLSDTKRYQMLGNSIAVPCAAYIMQGICHILSGD